MKPKLRDVLAQVRRPSLAAEHSLLFGEEWRTAGFLRPGLGSVAVMSRSDAQRAENESTFRRANEDLERKAQGLDFGEQPTPYLCECEDPACTQVVMLARSDYEAVRKDPRQFLIVPGHDAAQDKVVMEQAGFNVVEKTGEEGRLVEKQDPRREPSR